MVGVPFTDGKVWQYKTAMACEQHCVAVEYLGPCSFYQREPGSD